MMDKPLLLTPEQLERIAKNRERALALQKLKKEGGDAPPSEGTKNDEGGGVLKKDVSEERFQCEQILPDSSHCKNLLDGKSMPLWENFGEKYCGRCQITYQADLEYVTKANAMEEYLVPASTFAVLKFTEKVNPKHTTWAPMRLYLRKHVKAKAMERWKDEEGLQAELSKRHAVKFQKDLEATAHVFERTKRIRASATSSNSNSSSLGRLVDGEGEGEGEVDESFVVEVQSTVIDKFAPVEKAKAKTKKRSLGAMAKQLFDAS